MTGFVEVGDRVYVWRYPMYDVNTTLIVANGAAAVVDTLSVASQGRRLRELVRAITADPIIVINTHYHFDHCFGNAEVAVGGRPIYGHPVTAQEMHRQAAAWQHGLADQWRTAHPELVDEVLSMTPAPPTEPIAHELALSLADRQLQVMHLGRGHTEADLVVQVPDANVVLTGDLVEEGGPPGFGDGYPLDWPDTLAAMLHLIGPDTMVIPGHGARVDHGYVVAQHQQLSQLDWLIRDGHADGAPASAVAERSPFGAPASLEAVQRGYAQLAGEL